VSRQRIGELLAGWQVWSYWGTKRGICVLSVGWKVTQHTRAPTADTQTLSPCGCAAAS